MSSVLVAFVVVTSLPRAAQAADLLIIDRIECVKAASGIDDFTRIGFGALGVLAAGAFGEFYDLAIIPVDLARGEPPFIFGDLADLAAGDPGGPFVGDALDALDFLDDSFSGQDDLIIQVNGRTIVPTSGTFFPIEAGDVFDNLDLRVSIEVGARIQLIEFDSGSDNDDLGFIDVRSDAMDHVDPGADYAIEKAIVFSPGTEEGTVYYVSYRVLRDAGTPGDVTNEMLCGTNQCRECLGDCNNEVNFDDLDRDGDLEDLKTCPYPLVTDRFIRFEQFIVDDVFLRECARCSAVPAPTSVNLIYEGGTGIRPLLSWVAQQGVEQYRVFVRTAAGNRLVTSGVRFNPGGVDPIIKFNAAVPLPPGEYEFSVQSFSPSVAYTLVQEYEGCESASIRVPVTVLADPLPNEPLVIAVVSASDDAIGLGSGSIDVSPAPVSQVGGNFYIPGTVLTLTAVPNLVSEFVGWAGSAAACADSPTCVITIAEGMDVQVIFKPRPVLDVGTDGSGSGTVTRSPQGTGCFDAASCAVYSTGDVVSLTATPDALSVFDHWEGDSDCDDGSVTMDVAKRCTAVFERTDHVLTVTASSGGSIASTPAGAIDCGLDCEEIYPVSGGVENVSLTATVAPGDVFVRWYGDLDCYDQDENDGTPTSITVTINDADIDCRATSVLAGTEFALTVEKIGGGFGRVTAAATPDADSSGIECAEPACSQVYAVNTMVQLSATADRGSIFEGFDGDSDCVDGLVTMTANLTCSARFSALSLLVDGSNFFGSLRPEYEGVFNNIEGADFDEWSVQEPNQTSNPGGRSEPIASDLEDYANVIWFTGNASDSQGTSLTAGPSSAAEAALGTYLDSGGCLMLSSSQYFGDRGLTPFAQTYLGVSSVAEDISETQVVGAGDVGFGELGPFNLSGNEGLTVGLSDAVVSNPDASGNSVLLSYTGGGDAAVATDDGVYRTAFFGFPFLTLSSGTTRNVTMGAFFDYCQQPDANDAFEVNDDFDSASEPQGAVLLEELQILSGDEDYFLWESPWYANTKFSIQFDHDAGDLAIEVYDASRDLVANAQTQDDDEEIVVADVDAGDSYFVRVFGASGASNRYSLEISTAGPLDRDHDGAGDDVDAFPEDPSEQFDADDDDEGDNADTDDDNDGMPDSFEMLFGLNPQSADDATEDSDMDGFTNREEFLGGTDPMNPNSFPFVPEPEFVPEPSAVLLSGTALIALAWLRRRENSRNRV